MPHFVPTQCFWIKFFASHHVTVALARGMLLSWDTLGDSLDFCLLLALRVISTEAGTWRAPEPGGFSILHNQPCIETLDKC